MEIGIRKKGDLQILALKGRIHLQHWRVVDRHLETLLANGARWVAMDVSDVSLICSTGIGSLMHNIRKFQERESALMLVAASAYTQGIFRDFGCETFIGESIFTDWRSLEKRLHSQGLALTGP